MREELVGVDEQPTDNPGALRGKDIGRSTHEPEPVRSPFEMDAEIARHDVGIAGEVEPAHSRFGTGALAHFAHEGHHDERNGSTAHPLGPFEHLSGGEGNACRARRLLELHDKAAPQRGEPGVDRRVLADRDGLDFGRGNPQHRRQGSWDLFLEVLSMNHGVLYRLV